jgi:hypothetical protein
MAQRRRHGGGLDGLGYKADAISTKKNMRPQARSAKGLLLPSTIENLRYNMDMFSTLWDNSISD